MLHRINWTQAARPRGEPDLELDESGDSPQLPAKPDQEEGETASLENNRCDCVWEGDISEHTFKNFRPKACPTDASAREALGPKLASRWDAAKKWRPQDEELI